ncbi:MAG TPA: Ada metal-binding domain-containing protein [Cyclobacteriaceae bacterium]|nr:Ada metal-binding domain-containing protein [Cyclobacteriaceae bacterium]
MWRHNQLNEPPARLIRRGEIKFAGNARLKIYGMLHCSSGKRMKKENRLFFKDEAEAMCHGFRRCKKCMK